MRKYCVRAPGLRLSGPRLSGPRLPGPRLSGPRLSGPRLSRPRAAAAIALSAAVLSGCGLSRPGETSAHSRPASQATESATPSPSASSASTRCPRQQLGTHTYPYANGLTGVQFVSPTQGWAVGLNQIVHTTDAGRTWTTQDRGNLQLTSVDFIDANHGWAVGANMVLVTSDGGAHWSALPATCPRVRSVHFVTPTMGFAVAGGTALGEFSGILVPQKHGIALRTTNGGRTWTRLSTPADTQSICFQSPRHGWLGADGHLYRSTDGGRTWTLVAVGPHGGGLGGYPLDMIVQCAGTDSVWAEDIARTGAASQQPHIGYHAGPGGAAPIFAEQYFPYPGVAIKVDSPGAYAGPMSALSASQAVFIGWCDACGRGTAPWVLATGTTLLPKGKVGGVNVPTAASFLSPDLGFVAGVLYGHPDRDLIVGTSDGGRTWRVLYSTSIPANGS